MTEDALASEPLDGFWRVAALVRCREGTTVDGLRKVLVETLEDDARLVRLVLDSPLEHGDAQLTAAFPPPAFDAMFEFWFETAGDAVAVFSALDRDENLVAASDRLIDRENSAVWLGRCNLVKPESGASGFKLVAGSRPPDGVSVTDAQAHWRIVHPRVAGSVPEVWNAVTRYVQFHGVAIPDGFSTGVLGRWRCVPINAEACYADAANFAASVSSEGYRAVVRPDEEKFSSQDGMSIFLAGEEAILISHEPVPS